MGQKTKSCVLEIRVRLLCEFIKDCDTEILLIHITFHPREQDKLVTTSGNNRSSWKKFDPRAFLKLPIQIWSLLCLQSTQSKPTLSCKSPLAATSMYIFMQTNDFVLHRVQPDREVRREGSDNLYGFWTRAIECFLAKAFCKSAALLILQKGSAKTYKLSGSGAEKQSNGRLKREHIVYWYQGQLLVC